MTPSAIVEMILKSIGYEGKRILSKKIMEPSFGDGAFLISIVQKIISESKSLNLPNDMISNTIQNNVFGIEKDKALYDKAISKLNNLLIAYDLPPAEWNNLICGDTLLEYEKFSEQMDYVIGNPPYVKIHNIPEEYRDVVKSFKFSSGMIDLYITFYEIGLKLLKDTGKLGYITPNTFMRNSSQKEFRNFLVKNKYISAIYDFKTSKMFDDVDTYTCICILNKNVNRIDFSIDYKEYSKYQLVKENKFTYEYFEKELKNKSWNLSSDEDINFLEKNKNLPIKISNIAIVQNGVATNKDEIYVIKAYADKELKTPYSGKHSDDEQTVYFLNSYGNVQEIESTILHRCVKASCYNGVLDNTYIIFPYVTSSVTKFYTTDGEEIDNDYHPLTEKQLKTYYPKAYDYLSLMYDELISRDIADKENSWFLFGRSQGIKYSCYKKIIFKHIMPKHSLITPYILDSDIIIYSGIYTTIDINIVISPKIGKNGNKETNKYVFNEKTYDKELEKVSKIYASQDFSKYCSITGKDLANNYIAISTSIIKQFGTSINTFSSFPLTITNLDTIDKCEINKMFTDGFVNCIKESYENMGKYGKSSTQRIIPFHSYLAKMLQYKLGTDYEVYCDGYAYSKEINIGGNFDSKNVDICVKKNDVVVGAIAFKLLSNNFKQNLKNFTENMLGESLQMKTSEIPYGFCYVLPEKALYLNKNEEFIKIDKMSQNDLKVFYDICTEEKYKKSTPDVLFIGLHKLFNENYLNSLKKGTFIDSKSEEYLNNIQPEWSDYSFVNDEEIKEYFSAHSNIGDYIDYFISLIKKKEENGTILNIDSFS